MTTAKYVVEIDADFWFTTDHLFDAIEVGMNKCRYGELGSDFDLRVRTLDDEKEED